MAAFGIPQAHEDDAERAVRAGARDPRRRPRARASRRGSGSSPARSSRTTRDSTFATGEAVNVAARLQQAAEPGEILLGPARTGSTLGRVEVEDVGPLELQRARRDDLGLARRLRDERAGRRTSPQAPLVGRDAELELLAEHVRPRRPRPARAPRSRSTASPASARAGSRASSSPAIEGATVLSRPLPAVRRGHHLLAARRDGQVARPGSSDDDPTRRGDREARARPARTRPSPTCSGSPRACSRRSRPSAASRRSPGPRASGRSELADAQPLVLVFEDIHWAEEPLLELIEHLAELGARGAAADRLPRAARAARHPPGLGRRPRARDRDRARAARRRARARS